MRLLPCLTGLLLFTTVAGAQPAANYNAGPGPGYDPSQQPMPDQGPAPGPGAGYDAGQPQGGPGYGAAPQDQGGQQGGMQHQGGGQRARIPFKQRFETANVTHDGRLTLDQARQGRLGMVVHNFGQIDADHKGYVTVQDVHAWHHARHQAQMAQQQGQGQAPPPQR